ncbi:hypothetical protein ACIBQ6_15120 [Nonomuraea sp. NPDC049655]|uniref:hypothetical protein n=1 Tax=Nonomuraea sp. NPDC049655 TaxID=3364355 RepID=UPI0037AB5D1E
MPRDRDGSFEPKVVRRRQRWSRENGHLRGCQRLTTGEISAVIFADVVHVKLRVLTEIKTRRVDDALMVVCDGLKGLPQANHRAGLAADCRADVRHPPAARVWHARPSRALAESHAAGGEDTGLSLRTAIRRRPRWRRCATSRVRDHRGRMRAFRSATVNEAPENRLGAWQYPSLVAWNGHPPARPARLRQRALRTQGRRLRLAPRQGHAAGHHVRSPCLTCGKGEPGRRLGTGRGPIRAGSSASSEIGVGGQR